MLNPTVTCLCLTRNRREWLPRAIASFQQQTYAPRELLIVADGVAIADIVPPDDRITVEHTGQSALHVGTKRNLGNIRARGSVICHWDDDDWSSPYRLAAQVEHLEESGKPVVGFDTLLFRDLRPTQIIDGPNRRRAGSGWWIWRSAEGQAAGTSFCYRRSFWQQHHFQPVRIGEDNAFWQQAQAAGQAATTGGGSLLIATNHDRSLSNRAVGGSPEWFELPGRPNWIPPEYPLAA